MKKHDELRDERIAALAEYMGEEIEDAERYLDRWDYRVLTDKEADEAVRENISESVWAFRTEFLAAHTNIDTYVIGTLQEKCEDANDALRRLIKDFDHFVEDAVSSDGRGHFLSSYDGEENEITNADGQTFYIYRQN